MKLIIKEVYSNFRVPKTQRQYSLVCYKECLKDNSLIRWTIL